MDASSGTPETQIFDTNGHSDGAKRLYGDAGRHEAARLRAEVHRRRIVKRWLAQAIGKSYNQLVQVLAGNTPSWVTLGLVGDVLAAIDAGQIAPETHPAPVAPALAGAA